MPCVIELVKLYFGSSFNDKEFLSILVHKHSVVTSTSYQYYDFEEIVPKIASVQQEKMCKNHLCAS